MKSVVSVPEKRNDEKSLNMREEYAAKFKHLESTSEHKNLIFLDKVGFSVLSCPKRGRLRQNNSTYETRQVPPPPMLQFLQLKAEIFQW